MSLSWPDDQNKSRTSMGPNRSIHRASQAWSYRLKNQRTGSSWNISICLNRFISSMILSKWCYWMLRSVKSWVKSQSCSLSYQAYRHSSTVCTKWSHHSKLIQMLRKSCLVSRVVMQLSLRNSRGKCSQCAAIFVTLRIRVSCWGKAQIMRNYCRIVLLEIRLRKLSTIRSMSKISIGKVSGNLLCKSIINSLRDVIKTKANLTLRRHHA